MKNRQTDLRVDPNTNMMTEKIKEKGKKGQAALEYLLTYGWAILLVVAIIAILLTVVTVPKFENCYIATPFQCEKGFYRIQTDGNLTIEIKNFDTTTYEVNSTVCGSKTTSLSDVSLPAGGSTVLYFNCTNKVPASVTRGKDFFKDNGDVYFTYYPVGRPEFAKVQYIQIQVAYS